MATRERYHGSVVASNTSALATTPPTCLSQPLPPSDSPNLLLRLKAPHCRNCTRTFLFGVALPKKHTLNLFFREEGNDTLRECTYWYPSNQNREFRIKLVKSYLYRIKTSGCILKFHHNTIRFYCFFSFLFLPGSCSFTFPYDLGPICTVVYCDSPLGWGSVGIRLNICGYEINVESSVIDRVEW